MFTAIFSTDKEPAKTDLGLQVVDAVEQEVSKSPEADILINAMVFSFTDFRITEALTALTASHHNIKVRIIGDWKQGSPQPGSQLALLARTKPANVLVRFKNDQPYIWDKERRQICWSYGASRGLLHHKTMSIRVAGEPKLLICGSFNWTKAAQKNYENLLFIRNSNDLTRQVMLAMEYEFEAFWSDGKAALSPEEAAKHYQLIRQAFTSNPEINPLTVIGLGEGDGAKPEPLCEDTLSVRQDVQTSGVGEPEQNSALIAFNVRRPCDNKSRCGYHISNSERYFFDANRRYRMSPGNLAIRTLAGATEGDTIILAMHGLSTRSPEYCALLDALRKGVRCLMILDRNASRFSIDKLKRLQAQELLPMQLIIPKKVMHQKYLVHLESDTVVTGTANMSMDAHQRHTEHRLLIRGEQRLTQAFVRNACDMAKAEGYTLALRLYQNAPHEQIAAH